MNFAAQVKALQNMTGAELAASLRAAGFTVQAAAADRVLAENARIKAAVLHEAEQSPMSASARYRLRAIFGAVPSPPPQLEKQS